MKKPAFPARSSYRRQRQDLKISGLSIETMEAIYLIANGDLRIDANQKCEAAQAAMEKQLTSAIGNEGAIVQRAHPYDPEKNHGFIDSQK
jgi:hypothetical protein